MNPRIQPEALGMRQLLARATLAEFFATVWEREALHVQAALHEPAQRLLSQERFEELMPGSPLGPSGWLSVVEGGIARPLLGEAQRSARLAPIYAAYRRGCTLLQSGVQLRSPPVAELCRDVENDLLEAGLLPAEPVGANAYLSPARSRGFGLHYDNHCVLVIQLQGHKRWQVFSPQRELPLQRCEGHIPRDSLGEPRLQLELAPGDVLYIPRGFPHAAHTGDHSSLHLTLSLRVTTWVEALTELCRDQVELRRSLSATPTEAGRRATLKAELLPLIASLDVDAFIRGRIQEWIAKQEPLAGATLRAIDRSDSVDEHSPLTRASTIRCVVSEESGEAVLRFPGATLRLPAAMRPVFEFIAATPRFRPLELPAIDADYNRVELARVLVLRGLLHLQPPPLDQDS